MNFLCATFTTGPWYKRAFMLATIPLFHIIGGISFDYMQIGLLDITQLLLHVSFCSTHSKQLWYLWCPIKETDGILCAITPPDEILRAPRSTETMLKYCTSTSLYRWRVSLNYLCACSCSVYPCPAIYMHMQLFSDWRNVICNYPVTDSIYRAFIGVMNCKMFVC